MQNTMVKTGQKTINFSILEFSPKGLCKLLITKAEKGACSRKDFLE